jgi:hypothetical protein
MISIPDGGVIGTRGRREPLASEPCGIVGRKENGDARDVVRLSDTTKRSVRDHCLFEIAANDAGAMRAFSFDTARRNSIDATAAPASLKRLAIAAPMPFDAPVTTATLSFKWLM